MTHDFYATEDGTCEDCGERRFSPEHLDDESLRQEMDAAWDYYRALLGECFARFEAHVLRVREGT